MNTQNSPLTTDRISILAAATLLLAGCSYAPAETATGINVTAGGGSGEVQEITLKDGTRCAVVMGYEKGAISCNWRGAHD